MKTKVIPSTYIKKENHRLDCNPFMSGALEARIKLESLKAKKEPLHELTEGYNGGIYNGPQFKRNYVQSKDYGVPFLTSGGILNSDISDLPLLRIIDAHSKKLSYLEVKEGMTLISCSGTIGRLAYARPDMDGIWSSQDVLKVVPDKNKISPGFLYAYLNSKFGIPLIVSGTYGAIIQHIEPEHISDLPVPRIGSNKEKKIHDLIDRAANHKSEANKLLLKADDNFNKQLGIEKPKPLSAFHFPLCFSVNNKLMFERFDAYYFAQHNIDARLTFDNIIGVPLQALGSIARVYIPNIFKRIYASDPKYGVPYLSGAEIFYSKPQSERYLTKKVANKNKLTIQEGMLLSQEAGAIGGSLGKIISDFRRA